MIVQTIEISMSKGRAADILAHVGEEGREIEFIPDVELSADDHTAEIDTVKPDGTFTITNCNIDENGHIIAPITEQAVAVKGLCHYIVKVYNDDLVIYSASGSLWVDDHLITDDMIESVAEVNGYRFPQDFLTNDDLVALIDDNEIVSDKTWSSQKINAEISAINVLHNYSTNEQVVGKWIDNKPLYERVISVENPTRITSEGRYVYSHTLSVPNIGYLMMITCSVYDAHDNRWFTVPYYRLVPSEGIESYCIQIGNTIVLAVFFLTSQLYNITKICAVCQYTKTTD